MRGDVLLVCVLCCTWTGIPAVSQPPSIYSQPNREMYFKAGEPVVLPCVAEASPNASYTWKMNGFAFNPSGVDDRVVQLPNVGTINITRPDARDEAIYQCFAENSHGKSATITVSLREAKLMNFDITSRKTYLPQLGSSWTLPCIPPESVPPAEVTWVLKQRSGAIDILQYDARVTMDHEFRLRITNVKSSDNQNGKAYVCMAWNSFVQKNTLGPEHFINPVNGTEQMRPVSYLWASPTYTVGLLGDQLKIKCIFAGNPTPNVWWTAEGDRPLPDHAMMESFGQELKFDQLQFSDSGNYTCSATNALSPQRVQRTISIQVESRPYWTEEPKDVEIGVGETARFKCFAAGIPAPTLQWFINTIPLAEVTDTRIYQPLKNEIILRNATSEDSMVIQCNVTNKHGYIWSDVYLNVIPDSVPIITVPPAQVEVVAEGQSVNLTCRTMGKPDALITWYKGGAQITDGRYRTLDNGDLHIANTVLADAGTFLCVAINKYGSQTASGDLMVRRKTQIVQRPIDRLVDAGYNTRFMCVATTDPAETSNLQIKWTKDNREITAFDQRMTVSKLDNSLTINGTIVADSGNYTCIATNGLDSAAASAILRVRDRPNPPTYAQLYICEKSTAIVRWAPGRENNAPILFYTVQYNTSFTPNQWVDAATVNSTMTTASITLSPYANFTFRVLAHNEMGASDPSIHTRFPCLTPPDLPFKHPENVRTIGDKKNYIHVVWTPMPQIEHNGPGFTYKLIFRRRGGQNSLMMSNVIQDWTISSFTYPTPDAYKPYDIMLQAGNALGMAMSNVETIIGYSGEDVPTIGPSDLKVIDLDGTKVTLTWTFPMDVVNLEDTPVRGEFKGFKVQAWQRNQRETTMREWNITRGQVEGNSVGNQINATIDSLQPYTYFECQVAVMNNFYIGPPSQSVQFQTGQGDVMTTTTAASKSTTTPRWDVMTTTAASKSTTLPPWGVWTTTTAAWKTTTTPPWGVWTTTTAAWKTTTTPPWVMVTTSAPDGCDVSAIDKCVTPLLATHANAKGDKKIICPAGERAVSCLNVLIPCVNYREFTEARHLIDNTLKLSDMCGPMGQFPTTSSATTYHSLPLTVLTLTVIYTIA